jgi:hypothetical protein
VPSQLALTRILDTYLDKCYINSKSLLCIFYSCRSQQEANNPKCETHSCSTKGRPSLSQFPHRPAFAAHVGRISRPTTLHRLACLPSQKLWFGSCCEPIFARSRRGEIFQTDFQKKARFSRQKAKISNVAANGELMYPLIWDSIVSLPKIGLIHVRAHRMKHFF